jgi:hypothetical protein
MKVPIPMISLPRLLLSTLTVVCVLSASHASAQDPKEKWGDDPTQGDFDLWSNEAKVTRGAVQLAKIYEAAGGLEEWGKVEGIRFDLLETWRVETNATLQEFKVHHRVPRLCWFERDGDGFVRSEYVSPDGVTPNYRREVSVGNYSWAESTSEWLRKPAVATRARARVSRLFLLSCMPFSLQELGGEMVFLKKLEAGKKALFGIRLGKSVVMNTLEEQSQFVAVVDLETNKIIQLQYSLYDQDKLTTDESTECAIDFVGELKLGGVTIPNKHFWSMETGANIQEFWVEDVVNESIPAIGIQRPWQSGSLFQTSMRADHWDPPVKDGAIKEVEEVPVPAQDE